MVVDAINIEDVFRQIQTYSTSQGGRGPYHWPAVQGAFQSIHQEGRCVLCTALNRGA